MKNAISYNTTLSALLSLIILMLSPQHSLAAKRIALVIGNADYRDAPLTNPVNDAVDISEALKQTGFEVDYHINIDRKQMREAIRNFGDKLRKADVGLFYFAGHGIQIKGRNYLIPLAADVHSADEVQDESIDAGSVLRKMENAGNAVNIVILDACRNNPFARSFRSMESGLARMDGPVGSFIAYATAPGSVAADGSGRNGVYTQHLLKALRKPGLTIEQTFKHVRNGVKNETAGRQIPWESSSLLGEFVFLPIEKNKAAHSYKTIPAPPPVSLKYLQVIANVPKASVKVNNVNRGLINDKGVLNLANLTDEEVEVTVEAKGYVPQHQRIRLKEGRWEQLHVTLHPKQSDNAKLPGISSSRHDRQKSASCDIAKPVLLVSKMIFRQGKEKKTRRNAPALQASIMQSFKSFGMNFIDVGLNRNRLEAPDIRALAIKHKLQYLLKATVNVRELPIKVIKTHMKTVNAEVTLELLSVKNKRILASTSRSFSKAGLDTKRVAQRQLENLLPSMSEDLINQACRNS